MSWFKDIKKILEQEPEHWLAYLHGQQLDNLPHLLKEKPRYRGFILQVAKYGATLLRGMQVKPRPELKCSAKFFVFSGTANQMDSLDQTIDSLKQRGETVIAIANKGLLKNNDRAQNYIPFALNAVDSLRSIILLFARGVGLYKTLKAKNPVSIDWHFSTFCSVYNYLVYFHRVLGQVKPEFVITSNDHNVPNRCMLAVAHHLGIKTVYLQHASVSPIFPALRINYAFLDGQCALDIYRQCEPNRPNTDRHAPLPKVILSGQKKHIKRSEKSQSTLIGVAFNVLDDAEAGIAFINALQDEGLGVRVPIRFYLPTVCYQSPSSSRALPPSRFVSLSASQASNASIRIALIVVSFSSAACLSWRRNSFGTRFPIWTRLSGFTALRFALSSAPAINKSVLSIS